MVLLYMDGWMYGLRDRMDIEEHQRAAKEYREPNGCCQIQNWRLSHSDARLLNYFLFCGSREHTEERWAF